MLLITNEQQTNLKLEKDNCIKYRLKLEAISFRKWRVENSFVFLPHSKCVFSLMAHEGSIYFVDESDILGLNSVGFENKFIHTLLMLSENIRFIS